MTDLSGRTALVTGSVQGIGLAVARTLASAGARIAVHGLADAEQVAAACAELEVAGAPEARFFDANLANPARAAALVASVDKASYVASKFGLVGLSRVAALDYARAGNRALGGVTVNCICPGWTENAIIEPQIAARAEAIGGDREAGIAELLSEKRPSRRTSDSAEIGELALWLCFPVPHNATGTAVPIDGGWTAQ